MEPTTFTARSPEDLLALAPLVLGFQPEESLVMLTFGDHAFHARIDLPASRAEDHAVVGALLGPVLEHDLRRVVLLVFSVASAADRPGRGRSSTRSRPTTSMWWRCSRPTAAAGSPCAPTAVAAARPTT